MFGQEVPIPKTKNVVMNMDVKVYKGNIEKALRVLKRKREKNRLDHDLKIHALPKKTRKKVKRKSKQRF